MDIDKLIGLKPDNIPQIQLQKIDALVPYAANSRTHSPAQIGQIENSLLEWGWTNPVLADDMGIVAGHGRVMAAANIYKRGEQIKFPNGTPIPIGYAPVIDCTGWTVEQRRAYIIADNQIALNAGYDEEILSAELRLLEAANYNLELIGFSDDQLAGLLATEEVTGGDGDPDDAPAAPEVPVSVEGDVWVCGAHRVMCGSSLSKDDWERLMAGERADACWTDPPYNVDIGGKNEALDRADKGNRGKTGGIKNDKMGGEEFQQFLLSMYQAVYEQMKPGAPIYVAHADKEAHRFRSAFEEAGFKFSGMIIWKKNVLVLGMSDYQPIHEPIIYGWRPGSKHRWYGGRKNTTVIDMGDASPFQQMEDGRYQIKIGDSVLIVPADAVVEEHPSSVLYEAKPAKSGLHPTQKPVALVERMLKQSARAGDIVIDAFGGSGTTLLAADRLGMSARLMELDPKFVDVIVRRWEQYTGRRAVHAFTGEPFPAEGEGRQPPSDGIIGDGTSPDIF